MQMNMVHSFAGYIYIFKSGRPSRQMVQTQLGGSIGRNAWTWPQHRISKWSHDKLDNTNAYIIHYNLMHDHGCTLLAAMVMDVSTSFFPIARKTSPLKDSHVVAGSTLWNQTMEVIQMTSRRWYDTCWMTLSLRHGVPWWFRKKVRFYAGHVR